MILTLLMEKTDKKEKKESLGSGNDRSEAFFAHKITAALYAAVCV